MTAITKIYLTICLALIAIFCIKIFVPAPYINKEMQNEFWIKKTHASTLKNIVIGGDSRTYRSVSTKQLLEGQSNFTAVNLGYSGGGFNSEYLQFMYKRIDTISQVRIMVFGITPHAFLKKSSKNDQMIEYQKKTSSEIFSGKHYASFLKHFPPYTPYELFDDSSETYLINYHQDGYAASDNLNGDFDYTYWRYWDTFSKEKVTDSLVNIFIRDITEYQKKGITIIAFEPPTTPHMKEIETNHSGLNMTDFINKLKENNVHWINVDDSLYKSYDGSHIFHDDAERLSEFLGEEIKKIISNTSSSKNQSH